MANDFKEVYSRVRAIEMAIKYHTIPRTTLPGFHRLEMAEVLTTAEEFYRFIADPKAEESQRGQSEGMTPADTPPQR